MALNVDFDAAYRAFDPGLHYTGVLENSTGSFYEMGTLIQVTYFMLLRHNRRGPFTRHVNSQFIEYDAPLKMEKGRFINFREELRLKKRVQAVYTIMLLVFLLMMVAGMFRGIIH